MPPKITLQELYNYNKYKEKSKTVCFERVLELCHRRLRTIAQFGGMRTFFEVPGMLIGYPLYDLEECIDFTVKMLRKTGFLVQVLPPPHVGVLFINWDPDELRPKPVSSVPAKGALRGLPAGAQSTHIPTLPSRVVPNVEEVYANGLVLPKRKIL